MTTRQLALEKNKKEFEQKQKLNEIQKKKIKQNVKLLNKKVENATQINATLGKQTKGQQQNTSKTGSTGPPKPSTGPKTGSNTPTGPKTGSNPATEPVVTGPKPSTGPVVPNPPTGPVTSKPGSTPAKPSTAQETTSSSPLIEEVKKELKEAAKIFYKFDVKKLITDYKNISEIPSLSYISFFILYIVCFSFIFIKNAEVIAFSVLFIVNALFMIYFARNTKINTFNNKIELILKSSILITTLFHFISVILLFFTIRNINDKQVTATGAVTNLPEPYNSRLQYFKQMMVGCFALGTIIIILLLSMNFQKKYWNLFELFGLMIAAILIILSSIQFAHATEFVKLSRQQLINSTPKQSS
jgi:hypothetical protein